MSKLTMITTTAVAAMMALPAAAETTIRLSTYVNEADIRYEGFTHFADLVSVDQRRQPAAVLRCHLALPRRGQPGKADRA